MKSAKGQALPPLDQERNYSHSADTSSTLISSNYSKVIVPRLEFNLIVRPSRGDWSSLQPSSTNDTQLQW